jgi:hypothetical protein
MLPTLYRNETLEKIERALELLDEIQWDVVSLPQFKISHLSHKRKNVRFAPVISSSVPTISRGDLSEQEKADIWWTAKECSELRHRAKKVASYTRQEGASFTHKTLEVTFETALSLASAHDENSVMRVLHDPSTLVGSLAEWSRLSNARRGLEHRVVNSDRRASTACKHRKAVLSSFHHSCASLAEIAQTRSRASRIFARMVGFGDATVVEGTPEFTSSLKGEMIF